MGDPVREQVATASTAAAPDQAGEEHHHADPYTASMNVISHSFEWLTNEQNNQLDLLGIELKDQDEPSWTEEIVEGLIEVALSAVGARCGEVVAKHLISKKGPPIATEYVKKMFEEGTPEGGKVARDALKGKKLDIDRFVIAQKSAAAAANKTSQAAFEHDGPAQITTLAQAEQLEVACSQRNIEEAGKIQHDLSRDQWVSALAQAAFGGGGHPGEVADGPATTNMSTQRMRDDANKAAPGWEPEEAPSVVAAAFGRGAGVLEVRAKLPEIKGSAMGGVPEVGIALLNGVNDTIREQYEGLALGEIHIPRQIECIVEGDMPNFTINLDENGKQYGSLRRGEGDWLQARASVGHAENNELGEVQKQSAGLKLLLSELVPAHIKGMS